MTHDSTWPPNTTSRHLLHVYLNQEHALDVAWHEWWTLVAEGVV